MSDKPTAPLLDPSDPINATLAGFWPCYEGSGLTVHDISGMAYDGDLTGGTSGWTTGNWGPCLNLTGGTPRLLLPDLGWGLQEQYSGSVWAYTDPAATPGSLQWRGDIAGFAAFTGDWNSANYVYYQTEQGNVNSANAISTSSTWQHWAWSYNGSVTVDPGSVAIYRNGVGLTLSGSEVLPVAALNSHYQWFAAYYGGQAAPFTGKGDLMRLWLRVLTPTEVLRLYQEPLCGILNLDTRRKGGWQDWDTRRRFRP